jgi:GTP-binding protein
LLYGNQFEQQVENRRYRRGKTPVGAMIGKGIKAKVSDRPGETKSITFYQLSAQTLPQESTIGKTTSASQGSNPNARSVSENASNRKNKKKISLILADLPGFGFAYANEEKAKDWQELMKSYILHRGKSLKRVLFLIDARHGFKKTDFEFLEILQDGLKETKDGKRELPPIQMVLTKCDLVSQNDLARRMVQTRTQLSSVLRREPSALPIMLVSARAGLGFNNVRGNRARGGVLELQRELAALVPKH